MANTQFDVIVVGAGPGGYVAAIRAAQLNLKTAIVEAENLGGVCLNWGCIPTKALLKAGEMNHLLQNAARFGFSIKGEISHDWSQVIKRSRDISQKLTKGIEHLMRKNKVEVFKGKAQLDGKTGEYHKIKVSSEDKAILQLQARHVILATGAQPRRLPGLEPDGHSIWTSKEAMTAQKRPESLLVIGSGAIGVEFASFYSMMGTKVTIVEALDRILPVEDKEISDMARKSFEKQGIEIHTSVKVSGLMKKGDQVETIFATKEGKQRRIFEKALVAIGVVGNTEGLCLEGSKVKVEKNQIETNQWCETAEPGIYAIGDVAGAPWLAHKASHEGVIAAERIAQSSSIHPLKKDNIPGCTYSYPQIASVGLTEEKAKEKGLKIKVGRFPFMANGKALALDESEGLIKTIFDEKTGELLGAHMIGANVTELIQGYVIAKTGELTEAELMHTIFPHPTLSEMMHESVLEAYDKALHI